MDRNINIYIGEAFHFHTSRTTTIYKTKNIVFVESKIDDEARHFYEKNVFDKVFAMGASGVFV